MESITLSTLPSSIRQAKKVILVPAYVATLRRWKKPVNLGDATTVPLTFIGQHIDKGIPATIADRFGEVVVLDHVTDSEILYIYRLVFADKLSAYLMEKILPLVRDLFILTCKLYDCFPSVIRAFYSFRDTSLQPFQSPFRHSEELGRINHLSFRYDDERFDTEVDTYLRSTGRRWLSPLV